MNAHSVYVGRTKHERVASEGRVRVVNAVQPIDDGDKGETVSQHRE